MRAIAKRFAVERPFQFEGVLLQVAKAPLNIPIIDELPVASAFVDSFQQACDVLLAGERHLLPLRIRQPAEQIERSDIVPQDELEPGARRLKLIGVLTGRIQFTAAKE